MAFCIGAHPTHHLSSHLCRRPLHSSRKTCLTPRPRCSSDNDYFQAIKSYKQALRIDNDNLQILRDLSLLQVPPRLS